jgi:hypothetical protein
MRLPMIKGFVEVIEKSGSEKLTHAIEVLEKTAEIRGMTEAELEVVGELLSNMFGALEVAKDIESGKSRSEALNHFMQRVMGSIDR